MTTPNEKRPKRSIRSFVVRAGRMTKAQERGMSEFWDSFTMNPEDPPSAFHTQMLEGLPIVLEIGFGMGDTLVTQVKKHPDYQFVGIDVHPPGVGHVLNELGKDKLPNCRVYQACAKEVLTNAIPPASLQKVQIFFPDPWHKKRHHKRRLIQPDMVALIAEAVAPGGFCHLATDWENYAEHMQLVFANSSQWRLSSLSEMAEKCPVSREETRFERRGLRLGHTITDLVYERVDNA